MKDRNGQGIRLSLDGGDQPVAPAALSRRDFLRRAAGAALVGSAGLSLLAACGGGSAATGPSQAASGGAGSKAPAGAAAKSSAKGLLPTYAAIDRVKPDLPSGNINIPDGYLNFPKQQFKSVQEAPGRGGDVTVMTFLASATPSPLDNNPGWQALNKALNANLKPTIAPFAQYRAKLATTIASNDLPDILFILFPPFAELPGFLEAKCADLTPYLSGDAIKEYPNLAAIPTQSWKSTVFNNKIQAAVNTVGMFFWVLWVHQDLLDQIGAGMPKNADEFKRLLKQTTKPQAGQWGIASQAGYQYAWDVTNGLWPAIFGAPNVWNESGGKFTKDWETEQFKAAVGFARDVYAEGAYDPNSTSYNVSSARTAFQQRRMAFRFDGLTSVIFDSGAKLNPPSKLRMVPPFPAQNGGKPNYFFGSGTFGLLALKKAPAERIKELLRILNYLAAPFGSEEYLLVHYGVKGVEFNFNAKGNPIITDKGNSDVMPWGSPSGSSIISPAPVLFDPNSEDFPKVIQPSEKALNAVAVTNPAVGLWSSSDATKGAILNQKMGDGISDIVTGRRPLSDFGQLVKDWRSGGGDAIRGEYEKSSAASK